MTTLWDLIAPRLPGLKRGTSVNEWVSDNPFHSGSDSKGFHIYVYPDGNMGMFKNHAPHGMEPESGSLEKLAEELKIELTDQQRPSKKPKPRTFDEYATAHGVDKQVFIDAGWEFVPADAKGNYSKRPCLRWKVQGRYHYRYLDEQKPKFNWEKLYDENGKPITKAGDGWYGLGKAVRLAKASNLDYIILTNGEASVVVAHHHGIPACTWAGGEEHFNEVATKLLQEEWGGQVYVALDADPTGSAATMRVISYLRSAGIISKIIQVKMWHHGDVADVCMLHGADAHKMLLSWIVDDEKKVVEQAVAAPDLSTLMGSLRKMSKAELEEAQVYDQMRKMLNERDRKQASGRLKMVSNVAAASRAKLAETTGNPQETSGLLTYITDFDKAQGGFKPFLYVFLGAANMGKSQVAVSLAAAFLKQGPGLIVPTESTTEEWFRRLVAADTGISARRIELGQLNAEERKKVDASMARYESMDIGFLEDREPTPEMVRAAFEQGQKEFGWEWIIIDSISNMSAPGTSDTYQTVAHVAAGLLSIYQDFDIPVVGTSQIGRDVADRPKKSLEPRLTDGFGGGKIEHLANVVWGVYDHSYYVKQGMAEDNLSKYPDDTITLIQLKGKTGRSRPRVIVGVTDGAGITNVTLQRKYVNIPELTGMKAKEAARQKKESIPLDMPTMA